MTRSAPLCNACGQISAVPGALICDECARRGAGALVEAVEWAECLACRGEGVAPRERLPGAPDWRELAGLAERQCRECGGAGRVSSSQRRSQEMLALGSRGREAGEVQDGLEACPACDGAGCQICDGIGRVPPTKAEAVRRLIDG